MKAEDQKQALKHSLQSVTIDTQTDMEDQLSLENRDLKERIEILEENLKEKESGYCTWELIIQFVHPCMYRENYICIYSDFEII